MSPDGDTIDVCAATELNPGEREIVDVKGREIAVLNVDGEYFAILNRCLHQGGPLGEGEVHPRVETRYGDTTERIERDFADELAITCPLHTWTYSLEDGRHLGDDDIRVPTFDVVESDGRLYIDV